MEKHLAEQFDREVESYRRALLYCARKCDWDEFKARAGRLFDYLERVEAMVRERKFFQAFFSVMGLLILAVLLVVGWNPGDNPEWQHYKQNFIFVMLAVSSFEIFFYINFRRYVEVRAALFRKRREDFIRGLEQDFREYAGESMRQAA